MEEQTIALEKLVDDFARDGQISDYDMTDALLRLVCKYHFKEVCRKRMGQESEAEARYN